MEDNYEFMFKLILDGKTVGYELHQHGHIYHGNEVDDGFMELTSMPDQFHDHDHKVLGVKVNNEWWFEGDTFDLTDSVGTTGPYTLNYSKYKGWFFGSIINIFDIIGADSKYSFTYKKTGSIYEKGKP